RSKGPMETSTKGMLTRVLIVALFAVGGVFAPQDPEVAPRPLLFALAVITLLAATFSGWSMLHIARRRRPNENWNEPKWSTEPFSGLAHFLHTGGWSFVAFALVALLSDAIIRGAFLPWEGEAVTIELSPEERQKAELFKTYEYRA